MLKNEISKHQICLQSVLKHSVVHSQGIGMKFESFFFIIFFVKIGMLFPMNFISSMLVCNFDVLKLLFLTLNKHKERSYIYKVHI